MSDEHDCVSCGEEMPRNECPKSKRPCARCDYRRSHRFILVAAGFWDGVTADGKRIKQRCFDVLPLARCGGDSVGENAVMNRTVYRVEDGLENTQATHAAKPKRLAPTLPESR